MPRTKESARRVVPKPYDHSQPRQCCIMTPKKERPIDRLLTIEDEMRDIIESCERMKSCIDENIDLLDDIGYHMRYTYVRKTVCCMQKLCELELEKNAECRSIRGDEGLNIGT
jgi:hypothetical protein